MPDITPYKISVADDRVARLKRKLELSDLPDELNDAGWSRGVPLSEIRRLWGYWLNGYDWRKAEADLNQIPQFSVKLPVDGFETLDIHFLHVKSKAENAIPLLFAHGWPGCFLEGTKIIKDLPQSKDRSPAFHVVVPSLPNFGFSQGTKKKGFNAQEMSQVCHKLMLALGYDQYVTQGGDLGYAVTRAMALHYPQHCKAVHLNMTMAKEPIQEQFPALYQKLQQTPLTDAEKEGLARGQIFGKEGMGYFILQSTKPQTIGYSITDSPVGLLAWVYEKLHDWSDHAHYRWTDDEILTWVSIYWFSTAGPAASQRFYYEVAHDRLEEVEMIRSGYVPVKTGIATFPNEIATFPKLWNRALGDVVFESEWDWGGHFAAWERPEAIVEDLRKMFGKGGPAEGVVQGKSGYDD